MIGALLQGFVQSEANRRASEANRRACEAHALLRRRDVQPKWSDQYVIDGEFDVIEPGEVPPLVIYLPPPRDD